MSVALMGAALLALTNQPADQAAATQAAPATQTSSQTPYNAAGRPKQTAPAPLQDPALGGQGQNPGGTEPFSTTSPSPVTSDISPSPSEREANSGWEHWRRTNPIGRELRHLTDDGVTVRANWISNYADNPVGGNRQGFDTSGWGDAGADFDMQKLVGWSGATIHLQGAYFYGRSDGRDYVGNAISPQQTWRQVSGPRLTLLNVEQNLFDGKLNLMAGRAAVNSYYATSPLNCLFMSNTTCLALYGPILDIGITAFPNSSWSGKVRYAPTPETYAQIGAFQYDNALNTRGRDGLDFGNAGRNGAIIPGEVGYETSFANDELPRRYRLGFYYNTLGNADPYYDAKGGAAYMQKLAHVTYSGGRVGIYDLIDQTVWRERPGSKDNLALFERVFYNEGNINTVDMFGQVGLVQTGTFKDRHEDTIGLMISDTRFSSRELEYLGELRAAAGGMGRPKRDEIIGELNYGYEMVPGFRWVPNFQWVINPDPINAPKVKADIPNAIIIGLKVDVHFAELFGGRYTR